MTLSFQRVGGRARAAAFLLALFFFFPALPSAGQPQAASQVGEASSAAEWREPAAMRSLLAKSSGPERLSLYRAWLAKDRLEVPLVSEELGLSLASNFGGLAAALARELAGSLVQSASRGTAFWASPSPGELAARPKLAARSMLAAALLDRSETELAKAGLAFAAAAGECSAFAITKSRSQKLLAILAENGRELADGEARVLWASAWSTIASGPDYGPSRALASRVLDLSGYSLWAWSARTPTLPIESLSSAFSAPKLSRSEQRLALCAAFAPELSAEGGVLLKPRYPDSAASRKLFGERTNGSATLSLDIAALRAAPDWDAGLALARAPNSGASLRDDELVLLIEAARPAQSLAALSLLGDRSEGASADALSLLFSSSSSRDPLLLAAAARILIASSNPGAYDLLWQLTKDTFPELRLEACKGLESSALAGGDADRARAALAGLSHDCDPRVRGAAIAGLSRLLAVSTSLAVSASRAYPVDCDDRDDPTVEALVSRLLDPGEAWSLREASAKALCELGASRGSALCESVGGPVLASSAKPESGLAETLQVFLSSPPTKDRADSAARSYAAIALGELREASAVDVLLANIDTSRACELNYRCITALGRIGAQASLESLVDLAQKAWPRWAEPSPSPSGPARGEKNCLAASWALLFLEGPKARAFHLTRWKAASKDQSGLDLSAWCAALYLAAASLSRDSAVSTASAEEAEPYMNYLLKGLPAMVATDCELASAALDRFPLPRLTLAAASLMGGLPSYQKAWTASALIGHPEPEMIGAFSALLEDGDGYLAYAAMASVSRLLDARTLPIGPELRPSLVSFREALAGLRVDDSDSLLGEWKRALSRRLDLVLVGD